MGSVKPFKKIPSASYKPLARQEHLLTADLEGENVILDTKTNRALCLNRSMALIWRHCDGETTVAQMAAVLREKLHASADESSVWHSLRKLQKAKLLQEEMSIPEDVNLPSRRELFKVLGLGVGAITVMLIPTPAAAATCLPTGSPCTSDAQCCSRVCSETLMRCR